MSFLVSFLTFLDRFMAGASAFGTAVGAGGSADKAMSEITGDGAGDPDMKNRGEVRRWEW